MKVVYAESWGKKRWKWGELREGRRNGGRDRVRTCDLVVANDALSQLSYTPTAVNILANTRRAAKLVPDQRF
jgi:hypothetical protein